jgi:hypothetical protein
MRLCGRDLESCSSLFRDQAEPPRVPVTAQQVYVYLTRIVAANPTQEFGLPRRMTSG